MAELVTADFARQLERELAEARKDTERLDRAAQGIREMKYVVSKRFSFEAAHSLPHLPEGHKCRNLHGHSYVVEVFCEGPLDERGFVVDYADISAAVNPVIAQLDHQNLNELLPFHTTAENISAWLLTKLAKVLPSVSEVRLHETAKTCVRVTR